MSITPEIQARLEGWKALPECRDMQDDIMVLFNAVMTIKPKVILELGCGGGLSTRTFALASSLIPGSQVISVDIDQSKIDDVRAKLEAENLSSQCQIVNQDSAQFLKANSHQTLDFIFIDTSHTYEHTIAELVLALPMLSHHGYMFLHDTRYNEVWEAIQAILKNTMAWIYIDYTTASGLGLIIRKLNYWLPTNKAE
jgi:predicted O-methyltransferase YrrM